MNTLSRDAHPRKGVKRRAKLTESRRKKTDSVATYHYIGYIANSGHVWEMDGLNNGPIDLGEVMNQAATETFPKRSAANCWLEIVGSAVTTRMNNCLVRQAQNSGGLAGVEFNLLSIVESKYCKSSDRLQACEREVRTIERRLLDLQIDDWREKVSILDWWSHLVDINNTTYRLTRIYWDLLKSLSITRTVNRLPRQWGVTNQPLSFRAPSLQKTWIEVYK